MNEKFEYRGYWWLPDSPEERAPGILMFDPDEGATLELLGSLKGLEGVVDSLEPEIILGLSSDGKSITLKECGKTLGSLAFGSGFSTSSFYVNTVLIGEHFGRAEDVGFERLIVQYLHLEAWAHASGFDVKFIEETEEPRKRWMEVRHDLPDPFSAAVGNEYEVALDFASNFWASHRPFTEVRISQPAEIAIKFPEKQPLDRLVNIVFRLQHLLSLGMRRSAYPTSVRGYTGVPGEAMPVEVYYASLGRTDATQERPELHQMLFSRRGLPGGFGPAVARWLEGAEKLDPVYRLFLGPLYNPQSYLEQQFLSLVQALETYHRRVLSTPDLPEEKQKERLQEVLDSAPVEYTGWLERKLQFQSEPSLDQRLHEIFKRHLDVVEVKISKKKKVRADFIEKVVATRNYRSHFDESKKEKAARGEELYRISQQLKLLLEACLMKEIGFEDEEIKKAVLDSIREPLHKA